MPRFFKTPLILVASWLAGPVAFAVDPTPLIPGQWQLQLQDDFDGSSLDGSKWRLGTHYAGMAGTANTAPENVTVSDGKLRLKMEQRTTSYGGVTRSYATGEVSSFFNFRQQHGAFEARVKYPAVKGLWPAFWLMPDRGEYGWRDSYQRSYVKFDLTGVSPGSINTAELKMNVASVETGVENNVVCMRLKDDSWSEAGITWNNAPTPDPVWITQKWNQAVVGSDMTVNVKDFVTAELASDKKVSFVLADTFMRTKGVGFRSRESNPQSTRPRLVINGVTYYATEDASVRWGAYADTNYAAATELMTKDEWGNTADTWNNGMEIDIMESLGIWGADKTQHAMHWDGYGSGHKTTGLGKFGYPATADGFHVYGLYWEAGRLKFYVDGVPTYEWANSRVMSVPAYLILSLQAGGWDGNDIGPQGNNQTMEVDWVRVWGGTRSATPVAGVTGNGQPVTSGSITPDTANLTGFGYANVAGVAVTRTYTISNTGDAPLTLDAPVISGTNAADFTISSPPAGSVAIGGSTTFSVSFRPGAVGLRSAAVGFGTDDTIRNPFTFAIEGTGKTSTLPATAANGTWTNTAGGAWGVAGNWASAVAGGAGFSADFNSLNLTAPTTVSLDSEVALGSLVFGDATATADPASGANYVNGNTVMPTGGWIVSNSGNLFNTLTLDVAAGSPVITVNDLGSYYVAYGVTRKAATISAVIEGAEGLTKNGAGRLELSGANTFSGGLKIDAGTVTLSGTQGFAGGIAVTTSTSRVEFSAGANLGPNDVTLAGGGTIARLGDPGGTVGTGRSLTVGSGGGTFAISGYSAQNHGFNLTGPGMLTIAAGNNHLVLNGDNGSFTGGFQINSGAVQFQTALSLPGTGSTLINANGGLVGSGANATLSDWLASGRINTASTGGILLTGVTNSQDVDLTGYGSLFLGMSGLVNLPNNQIDCSGTITPAGTTYRIGHNLGAAQLLNLSQTNQLTGARNLVVGNGTALGYVQLGGANNHTLGTGISDKGRLTVSNSGALGPGAVGVSAGGELRLRDTITIGNALTLNGGPSDTAFGALHGFSGANIYGGNITLASGSRIGTSNTAGNSLSINGNIALGANSLSFTAGSTSAFAGGDITVAGAITGSGAITKNNTTGTLTLNAANTGWSGNTTLAGGTLALGNNAALGTAGTFTVSGSATVRSSDATDRTIARGFGTFAGTGAVYTFGATSGGTGNLAFTSTAATSLGSSAARTFQVHNTTKFGMGFSGTGTSINKTGNGTMIMNGTSTYTGGTTVTAGTLGGIGTIGATSVLAAGAIAPGDAGIGTLNTGAITVAGTLAIEFNGANCDKLQSTGAVDLGGATLTITPLGSFSGPYVIAQGVSVTGTMIVPLGYSVSISNGTQAILTQTGAPADYAGWASANGVTGEANGDSDHDGIPNAVEYALNLNAAGSDPAPGGFSGNVVTFHKRTATSGNSDLGYRIEYSADLGISVPWVEVGAYLQNSSSIISATLPTGSGKNFTRLRVVVTP